MSLVINLEAKRSGGGGSWGGLVVSWKAVTSREAGTVSSGKAGLISSDVDGIAAYTGKEDSSEFRGFKVPNFIRIIPYVPFQFLGIHSFPINALTLIVDTLQV